MSSSENALSSESIRSTCSTEANSVENVPPTRCVGESGGAQAGVLVLERLQLAQPLVVLLVRRHRGVADVVRELVGLDQVGQLRPAVPGVGGDLLVRGGAQGRGVVDLVAHGPIMARTTHTRGLPPSA